jgi:hypothetical protein
MYMRQSLMERFERESQTLPALREEHLRQVIRWVYSTAELWSCWDLHEIAPQDCALPGPEGAFYAYGFDKSGRRIMVREFEWNNVWVRENSAAQAPLLSLSGCQPKTFCANT